MAQLTQAQTPKPATSQLVHLPPSALDMPLGIEPEGGRFETVLARNAPNEVPGNRILPLKKEKTEQPRSTLAIYASDLPILHGEKPFARLILHGPAPIGDFVRVQFTRKNYNTILVETFAVDSSGALQLVKERSPNGPKTAPTGGGGVKLLAELVEEPRTRAPSFDTTAPPRVVKEQRALVAASRVHAGNVPQPDPIAAPPSAGAREPGGVFEIGERNAGGLFKPVFLLYPTREQKPTYKIQPRSPDQTTADVSLLIANHESVDNYRLWQRLLISGIPAGANRRIKLDFKVGPDGKVVCDAPMATLEIGGRPTVPETVLEVIPYSKRAAEQLQENRELLPSKNRHIPPAP